MIAKKVSRQTKDSFGRLARYAADETKQSELAQSWGSLAHYVADTENANVKILMQGVRLTNLDGFTDLDAAIREVDRTQRRASASENDRNYHLIISFPPGEVPTKKQLEDIEDELIKSIGLENHQRVSGIHTNTDCLHIHVAISKIHPESLKVVEPYRDQPKLMAACKALEIKHGLTQTHVDKMQMPDGTIVVTGKAADVEAKTGEKSLQRWMKENVKDDLLKAASWAELHDVAVQNGLELKKQGAGLVFVTIGNKTLAVKASDVDRSLSFKKTQDRLGPFKLGTTLQRGLQEASDYFEADQQEKDVSRHKILSDENQSGSQNKKTHPFNNLGPSSKKKPRPVMTQDEAAEHGMFEEDAVTLEEAKAAYYREPIHRPPEAEALWQMYNSLKEEAPKKRDEAMVRIKERSEAMKDWIKASRKDRKENAQTKFYSPQEQEAFQMAEDTKWKENREAASKAREEVFLKTRTPNWYEFLCQESEQGNAEALKILRQINKRREVFSNNILRASDWSEGKTIINDSAKKLVSKTGTVRYYMEDGGVVTDRPNYVGVQTVSIGAAALALTMASERFSRPLNITGSDEFKKAVAAAAAIPNSNITFSDPKMETLRKAAVQELQKEKQRYSQDAVYLFVPPNDKAEVKMLGAKWDVVFKRWYVPAKMNLEPFEKWRKVEQGADLSARGTLLVVPANLREFVKEAGAQWDEKTKKWIVPAGVDPKTVGLGDFVAGSGRYSEEKTFLHVPIWDKDEVKNLGARWDKITKAWFVSPVTDLEPFKEWQNSVENLVSAYVDKQNTTIKKNSIIKKHKAWCEGEVKDGVYAGTVELSSKLTAVLLETENDIIVKSMTPDETTKAEQITHGQTMSIIEKGRLSFGRSQDRSRGR